MMKDKGFAPVILIIIIAVVAIAVGGFVTSSKNTLPSPLSNNTNTANNKKTTFEKVSSPKLIFTGGYADPSFIKTKDGKMILYVNKFGPQGSGYRAYTSTDGIDWKEYVGSNLPNASTGRAVQFGDNIRFYYPGLMPIKPTDPPATILSSISKDGFSFTTESGTRIAPKSGYYLEGPTVIKLKDNTYRMYFNENEIASKEKRIGAIWGASSTDGLAWTRDDKETIKATLQTENMPSDWPQALHPFILTRKDGTYLMFYNTHSQVYAATSTDGKNWEKLGSVGIKGADVDGYYLEDGTIRLYYGDFGEQTSGVIYTLDIKEVTK